MLCLLYSVSTTSMGSWNPKESASIRALEPVRSIHFTPAGRLPPLRAELIFLRAEQQKPVELILD